MRKAIKNLIQYNPPLQESKDPETTKIITSKQTSSLSMLEQNQQRKIVQIMTLQMKLKRKQPVLSSKQE